MSVLLSVPSIVFWMRTNDRISSPTDLPLQDLYECGMLESSYIYSQFVPCYLIGTISFLGLFYRLFLGIKYQNMLAKNLQSPGAKGGGAINGKVGKKAKRSNSEYSTDSSCNSESSLNQGSVNDKAQSNAEIGHVIVHANDSSVPMRIDPDLATDSGRSSMNEEAGLISDEPQAWSGLKLVDENLSTETQMQCDAKPELETDTVMQTCCDSNGEVKQDTEIHCVQDIQTGRKAHSTPENSSSNFEKSTSTATNEQSNINSKTDDLTDNNRQHCDIGKDDENVENLAHEQKVEKNVSYNTSDGDSSIPYTRQIVTEQDNENDHSVDYLTRDLNQSISEGEIEAGNGCSCGDTPIQEKHLQSDSLTIIQETLSHQILLNGGVENPSYVSDELPPVKSSQNTENQCVTETEQSEAEILVNGSKLESTHTSTADETAQESLPVSVDTNDQECQIQSQRPSILKKNVKQVELERVCSTKSVSFAKNVKKTNISKDNSRVSSGSRKNSTTKSPGQRPKSPGHSKPKPPNRPALKLANAHEYMKKVNKEQAHKLMTRMSDNKGTMYMVLVMYMLYLGLTLPYQMYHVVAAVNRQTNKVEPVTENVKNLLALLQWIATCATLVNPIVYWLFSEHFRKGYAESYISCCDRDQKYYRERQKHFGMFKEEKS